MHDILNRESYPNLCLAVGLDCASCVTATAREFAKVCTGLRPPSAGELFVQLYPSSACAPMRAEFVEAYLQAPGELDRKPMGQRGGMNQAAVA